MRLTLFSLLALGGLAGLVPFSYPEYPFGCRPNAASLTSGSTVSLAAGNTAYVCVTINGKVTSIFNVVVDQYTAVTVSGSNFANPVGAGQLQSGGKWVSQVSLNASESSSYYTTFDLASFGAYSQSPRVFKKVSYSPAAGSDGTPLGTYLRAVITTFPVWTAIITLANGVPTGVRWDEGCFFCASNGPACTYSSFDATGCLDTGNSSVCSENVDGQHTSCYSDMGTCYPLLPQPLLINALNATPAANVSATPSPSPSRTPAPGAAAAAANATVAPSSCDLKIFVVWDGTDAKGNTLKSVNKRFSVYRAFSVASAFQSALNAAQQAVDIANSVQNIAQGLPGALTPGANDRRQLGEGQGWEGERERQEEAWGREGTHAVPLHPGSVDPPLPGIEVPVS